MSPAPARVFGGIGELLTPTERIADAALAVSGGAVCWRGRAAELPPELAALPRTDLGGRGVLPGLVDAHTHLIWAGSRLDEYEARARGEAYADILAAGGGLHATVAATRRASEDELHELARRRAAVFLRGGVTTLEVKSGYGLDVEVELRMLRVARRLATEGPQRIVATVLLHAPSAGESEEEAVDRATRELLPEVARTGLATAADVFIDAGAFSLAAGRRILSAAADLGLAVKAHAEQLSRTGAARLVAELGGLSADHLERADAGDLRALASAGVTATLLPGAALLLGQRSPQAAALRAAGVRVAVASDHNPGSSPLFGLLPALQLAVPLAGLNVEEALAAGTVNAGRALGRPELGTLEPGNPADFVVTLGPEALEPLYAWGDPRIAEVFVGGERAWHAGP